LRHKLSKVSTWGYTYKYILLPGLSMF